MARGQDLCIYRRVYLRSLNVNTQLKLGASLGQRQAKHPLNTNYVRASRQS